MSSAFFMHWGKFDCLVALPNAAGRGKASLVLLKNKFRKRGLENENYKI